MASYPGSIYNPTPILTGDQGQPSQVNDAYAELTAIETALITGPIQLPNSSLTALSVSGGSTLTTLNVTGGSTFANVTITGTIDLPRTPMCKVSLSANVAIPSGGGAFTGLSWDTESYDSDGMHSTVTNSSRIALNSSGLWAITTQIVWKGSPAASDWTRIMLDGVTPLGGDLDGAINIDPYPQTAHARYLATDTTHYITVQVQSLGSTGTVYGDSGSTAFGGCWTAVERLSR